MLEMLLVSQKGPRYYKGEAPLATFAVPPRAFGSLGHYQNKLTHVSGIGTKGLPYPLYSDQLTLAADKRSVTNVGKVEPYDGTAGNGTIIGSKLWYHMGHDGRYNNFLRRRDILTGAMEFTSSTYSGVGTVRQVVEALDNNNILVALGETSGATPLITTMRIYTISTNSWTSLPALTGEFIYAYNGGITNSINKRIYIGVTISDRIGWYDPATRTIGYSRPFTHLFRTNNVSRRLYDAGMCSYDKYLLFFDKGLRASTSSNMSVMRYNILTEQFDVFDFPMLPPRYFSRFVVDEAAGRIHLHSGSASGFDFPGDWSTSVKYPDALVFDATQFLRED